MTRATLLHVLDRPTALGPAEVRELEQLAQAFPYCQTAHLLLAKAAHDQGTMLAGQRLRRAATYAADRTLLRRLIEQVATEPTAPEAAAAPEAAPVAAPIEAPPAIIALPLPEPVAVIVPAAGPVAVAATVVAAAPGIEAPVIVPAPIAEAAPAPVAEVAPPLPLVEMVPMSAAEIAPPSLLVEAVPPVPEIAPPPPVVAEVLAVVEPPLAAPAPPAETVTTPVVDAQVEVAASVAAPVELPAAEPPLPVVPAAEVLAPEPLALPEETRLVPVEPDAPPAANMAETLPPAAVELPPLVDQEGASILTLSPVSEAEPEFVLVPEPPIDLSSEEADLPAQAPAIRPPVEVGEARFEFGLAEPAPPIVPTYELPGLVDEWAASAVTRSLGSPNTPPPATATSEPEVPAFTPAAFTGDATVGYAFGESSRLGLSMQLLDLLAAQAEAAETATTVIAAAQPPAVPLPPTGTFFEPDPLLLDHWTTHRPLPPALPTSLDLINNFLKRQPRLTRPAMLPPTTGGQADLSARSTRAEPDLVSENLARIYVRQGKAQRAIEIYEKLMVKHPEKMAYFAAQIQSLQPSA